MRTHTVTTASLVNFNKRMLLTCFVISIVLKLRRYNISFVAVSDMKLLKPCDSL